MPTLELDDLDLYPYVRVASGEGLDPTGGEFRQPTFGDTSGEGAPLINFNESNREFVIPVHVHKAVGGLPDAIKELNIACANAKVLKWQDESSTEVSYLDVLAAKFEPDYNYRRAGAGWMTGTVRVWTKPYSHTGTSILVATMAGTAPLVATLPFLSMSGDAPAALDVRLTTATGLPKSGRAAVIAAIPSGYKAWHPAASLSILDSRWIRGGNSKFVASQTIGNASPFPFVSQQIARLDLSPATMYAGRNRVFGLAHAEQQTYEWFITGPDGRTLSPFGAAASHSQLPGLVDLGVLNIPTSIRLPTISLMIGVATTPLQDIYSEGLGTLGNGLNGLIIVPDDKSMVVVDTRRRVLSGKSFFRADANFVAPPLGSSPIELGRVVDNYGNGYASNGLFGVMPVYQQDWYLTPGTSAALLSAGARIDHPTAADLRGEVSGANFSGATAQLLVGKLSGADAVLAKWLVLNGSQSVLSLSRGVASTLIASVAVSSIEVSRLEFVNKGPILSGAVYHYTGSLIASIAGSWGEMAKPGQIVMGCIASHPNGDILGHRVSEVPSLPFDNQDTIILDASDDSVYRRNSASVVTGDLTGMSFGQPPRLPPGIPHDILAWSAPLEGGVGSLPQSVEVRVRERFTYHR